jgi:hypothetical protein
MGRLLCDMVAVCFSDRVAWGVTAAHICMQRLDAPGNQQIVFNNQSVLQSCMQLRLIAFCMCC